MCSCATFSHRRERNAATIPFPFLKKIMSLVGAQNNTFKEKTTSNIIPQKLCAGGIFSNDLIYRHVSW